MSWSAAWAWLVLAVIVIAFVAVFDVHAHFAGTATMSGQFRTWLLSPSVGPVIFGLWAGIFAGLTFHWFAYRGK